MLWLMCIWRWVWLLRLPAWSSAVPLLPSACTSPPMLCICCPVPASRPTCCVPAACSSPATQLQNDGQRVWLYHTHANVALFTCHLHHLASPAATTSSATSLSRSGTLRRRPSFRSWLTSSKAKCLGLACLCLHPQRHAHQTPRAVRSMRCWGGGSMLSRQAALQRKTERKSTPGRGLSGLAALHCTPAGMMTRRRSRGRRTG